MTSLPAPEGIQPVSMYLLSPLPKTQNGHKPLLVTCNRFTSPVSVVPSRSQLPYLMHLLFLTFAWLPMPFQTRLSHSRLLSSLQCTSRGIWGSLLGMSAKVTIPYHPQTSGRAQHYNTSCMRQLRTYSAGHPKAWHRIASLLTPASKTQVQKNTRVAPFSFVSSRGLGSRPRAGGRR